MPSRNFSADLQFDLARYEIMRALGIGGAGAVFLVRDRETGEQLALKKLQRIDQKSIQRFKREFRSLAHVHHPNLIRLYDLGHASDGWFLTMEYVQGRSLSEELLAVHDVHATRAQHRVAANDQGSDSAFVARVIDLFAQLASGVRAIHQAGMLHRDLKPSNVIVAHDGRVVVLDFGLVRDIHGDAESHQVTQDGMVPGTPAYMSPEQASAEPLSEAADWYAFGVMLYEMLSGQLPIDGRNVPELLQRKLREEPAPIADDPSIPRTLLELCMQLLRRDPKARPAGEQVVAVLSALEPQPDQRMRTLSEELVTDIAQGASSAPLFGRDAELARLREAFERTRTFATSVAHVLGTSGAGKSALVEHFLDGSELAGRPDVLVLRSRCYEREAMPFKALDGVIDALVAHLATLSPITAAHLLPSGVAELTRIFPVFERLPVVTRLMRAVSGDVEARHRAEQALKELIDRLASDRQLVIWIDDLQWGDLDSASVIDSWLKQRAETQLLLIFSFRSEEIATSPCLKLLLAPEPAAAEPFVINLTPLSDRSVRELCSERLSVQSSAPPRLVERIVQEARGNPFLAQQLVSLALAKQAGGETDLENLSVEELVLRTVGLVSPEARALLHVLAIAGRPIRPGLALTAAQVERDGRSHIHALQTLRLVRTRLASGQRWIEVYHDRVREGVQALLSASEREQLHARLLGVLERTPPSDPDWLHELALGARQSETAYRYGVLAADRAAATLAFERAAELYARCLSLHDAPDAGRELWSKLAVALTRCRRGAEAAQAYLRAAELAEPARKLPLLRLAASHLLRSGRFEEGERLVLRVLELLGIAVPSSEFGLIAAIGWQRARVALRGYDVKPHKDREVRARLFEETELCGTLSVETQLYAPLRAAWFAARTMRLALECGEPAGIARAMCLAGGLACISGTPRAARHAAELFARATELAKQCDSDDLVIEVSTGRALAAMFLGRPHDVIEHSDAANRSYASMLGGGAHGDYFYRFAVNAARLAALQSLGRHVQARAELRDYLERAQATGNRAAILQVTLTRVLAERTLDNCATSRARLDAERPELPGDFSILHLLHMIATMLAACSNHDYDWAFARLNEDWPVYLQNVLHRTAYIASVAHFMHARVLLGRHVSRRSVEDPERLIRPDVRVLARLPESPYRNAVLSRLRARCAILTGDLRSAVASLRDSVQLLDDAAYLDEPERDRFAIGCLLGGSEGAAMCAAAEAKLRELGSLVPREELQSFYPELFAAGLVDKVTPPK